LQRAIAKEKAAWEEQKAIEKKEAQNVGYKVGYDAGYEDVFKEYEALIVEANNFTARAKADYDKTISKYDDAIIELAIAVAEKILANKLQERPEHFKQIVYQAIEDLKDSSNVEIYVHPSNYEMIMQQKEELEQMVRKEDIISIYMDQQLRTDGCLIKHQYGQVDVSIDTQLRQLKQVLEEKVLER